MDESKGEDLKEGPLYKLAQRMCNEIETIYPQEINFRLMRYQTWVLELSEALKSAVETSSCGHATCTLYRMTRVGQIGNQILVVLLQAVALDFISCPAKECDTAVVDKMKN